VLLRQRGGREAASGVHRAALLSRRLSWATCHTIAKPGVAVKDCLGGGASNTRCVLRSPVARRAHRGSGTARPWQRFASKLLSARRGQWTDVLCALTARLPFRGHPGCKSSAELPPRAQRASDLSSAAALTLVVFPPPPVRFGGDNLALGLGLAAAPWQRSA